MNICLLWVSCVVRQRSLRRADHSSRGVLPTVLRRCVWSRNIENGCSIYIYDISHLRVNHIILRYLGYEMPNEESWFYFRQDQDVFFCLLQIVHSGTGTYPAPRPVGIRSNFPPVFVRDVKVTLDLVSKLRISGNIPPLPSVPLWLAHLSLSPRQRH